VTDDHRWKLYCTRMRQYESDFVARAADGSHWLSETKGREDADVARKDVRAEKWCADVTTLTGQTWRYLKVPDKEGSQPMPAARHRHTRIIGILILVAVSYLSWQVPRSNVVDAQSCTPGSPASCLQLDGLEKNSTSASRYTVTNQGAASATTAHEFYPSGGGAPFIFNDTLAPQATKTYDLATISQIPNGFVGSVTIYADQPIAAELLPAQPTPTPLPTQHTTYLPVVQTPGPFIASSKGLILTSGTVEVVGEVVNPGAPPICYATIALRFYNAADQLVATDSGSTYLTATISGQPNPFKTVLSNAPADIDYYRTSLSWSSCFSQYRTITVLSQQVRKNPDPEVFGEIRNDNTVTVSSIDIGVTYYDTSGKVVYTDWDFPTPSTLAPSASGIYSARSFLSNLTYATIAVRAQGYVSAAAQSNSPQPANARSGSRKSDDVVQRMISEDPRNTP